MSKCSVISTIGSREQPRSSLTHEHQQVLWQISQGATDLSEEQKSHLFQLLSQYVDVFTINGKDLGRTTVIRHTIKTGTATPIRQPLRRLPVHTQQEVNRLVNDMLSKDIIERSTSPWASAVVLVKKKDGSFRFCVNYRKVNRVTKKNAYPLPCITDTLDTLAGSKWFTTLDLLSGYWQVALDEQDKEKTAFATRDGLYQFKVMPFGLCNGPATFQRIMDLVLSGLQWSVCLVYLDDVIVLGCNFLDHIKNLKDVLECLRAAGLKVKPSKCDFLKKKSVKYLGHVVFESGIATDPDKTEQVSSWPVPSNCKQLQTFLGLASYYRRFVKDLARPLHRLTEVNTPFNWDKTCQTALIHLEYG